MTIETHRDDAEGARPALLVVDLGVVAYAEALEIQRAAAPMLAVRYNA